MTSGALAFLVAAMVLTGCSSQRPGSWRDANGVNIGDIHERTTADGGREKFYIDRAGMLRRIEVVSANGMPPAGASVTTLTYDTDGHVTEREYSDAGGNVVENDQGYAIVRYAWSPSGHSCNFLEREGRAVARSDGVHSIAADCGTPGCQLGRVEYRDLGGRVVRVRISTYHRNRLVEIAFQTANGRPTTSSFNGLDVSRVRFDYVKAIEPPEVVVEHLLSEDGRTIRSLVYRSVPDTEFCS